MPTVGGSRGHTTRRSGFALLACLLALMIWLTPASASAGAPRHAGAPPNIVLFISDDHGWPDYGFQGHPFVKTPNVDRLADEGVLFTNGYSQAATCVPSLRTLLSGLPNHVWERLRDDLETIHGPIPVRRESQYMPILLGRMLRAAGYTSFAGGKMWEGDFADAGFDDGTMRVFDRLTIDGSLEFGRDSMESLFSWIDDQSGPWFAWVAPMLPHSPYDPPPDLVEIYEDVDISDEARRYYANVTRMDERLGELMAHLEETGQRRDTIVIYLADNGWEQRLEGTTPLQNLVGDDRGKAAVFDRSFHTPIIVHDGPLEARRDRLPRRWRRRADRPRMRIVDFEDVYATILDYAGVEPHACAEGRSFRRDVRRPSRRRSQGSTFRYSTSRIPFADLIPGGPLARPDPGRFLRVGPLAYTDFPDADERYLYDLRSDPDARNDLSQKIPWLASLMGIIADAEEEQHFQRVCPPELIGAGE